jgi:hypothetical protein
VIISYEIIIEIAKISRYKGSEVKAMTLSKGSRWICQNLDCRAEIVVEKSSELATGANPVCSCGVVLKQLYSVPTLTELRPEEGSKLFPTFRKVE